MFLHHRKICFARKNCVENFILLHFWLFLIRPIEISERLRFEINFTFCEYFFVLKFFSHIHLIVTFTTSPRFHNQPQKCSKHRKQLICPVVRNIVTEAVRALKKKQIDCNKYLFIGTTFHRGHVHISLLFHLRVMIKLTLNLK